MRDQPQSAVMEGTPGLVSLDWRPGASHPACAVRKQLPQTVEVMLLSAWQRPSLLGLACLASDQEDIHIGGWPRFLPQGLLPRGLCVSAG